VTEKSIDNRQPTMTEIIVVATMYFKSSHEDADRLALAAHPSAGAEELIQANRQAAERLLEFADLMERCDFDAVKALEAALAPTVNWILAIGQQRLH
jgi:hypothetical protein